MSQTQGPAIRSVLVANRGEIAARVLRSVRAAGLRALAVCSEADRDASFLANADEVVSIGPAAASESYLRADRILDAARRLGADAVHPGYGFLSENAEFARAVEAAGLRFIGPRPQTLEELGDKISARRLAQSLGIRTAAGGSAPLENLADLRAQAEHIGFPLLLKAAAGGGGKGIRIVRSPAELEAAVRLASSEAMASFGSSSLFCERFIEGARHVEVQVLGDGHGGVRVFAERDCSIQRRLQKLVEETPSPGVDSATRERLLRHAFTFAQATRYRSAGTFEFLLGADGELAFLEVNPRIQVEHPVTEMTSGLDLVAEQIAIEEGRRLPARTLEDAQVPQSGHAIELRLNAEDPLEGFRPSTGRVTALDLPTGRGVRVDAGLTSGESVTPHYDSLVAKIIAHAATRPEALEVWGRALRSTVLLGPAHTLPVGTALLRDAAFLRGDYDCAFLDGLLAKNALRHGTESSEERAGLAAGLAMLAALDRAREHSARQRPEPAPPISAWRTGNR